MKIALTDEQDEVARHRHGPGLVLAGAGSGKTSTISVRTIRLIEEGCPAGAILKMTFSRKAAGEMRHKMVKMAGASQLRGLQVDTFHAWGFRLIREFPERFGRTAAVTVTDETDQRRLIRDAAREAGIDLKESKVKRAVEKARSVYSYAKNGGLRLPANRDEIREVLRFSIGGLDKFHDQLMRMLEGYETRLRRSNALDFDDLCLLPGLALDRDKAFAELIGRRYRHVIIDEGQDTNLTQYWVVRAIGRWAASVLLIGDTRQGIYSFRGARIENTRAYIADFEPRQYLMRRNFRSTAEIVEAANALIAHNKMELGESFSDTGGGLGLTVIAAADGADGIRQIQRQFQKVASSGVPLGEIAFLGRVKRLSRLAEVAMSQLGVPVRVVGGFSIYESIEGRAAVGAARLLQNPHDGAALAAIAAFNPKLTEGVVTNTLDGVANGLSVLEALRASGSKGCEAAADLEVRLARLRTCGPQSVGEWVNAEWGLDMTGFYALKKDRAKSTSAEDIDKECERRQENLQLIDTATEGAIARVGEERAGRALDPGEYSVWVPEEEQWTMVVESRLDERDERRSPSKDVVTVSTQHRAKGLEWSYVFVLGMSESVLPLTRGEGDEDEDGAEDSLEEERRLAYVALTRAKIGCSLVHIEDMRRYLNRNNLLEPSRFIDEMGLQMPIPEVHQPSLQHPSYQPFRRSRVATGAQW